MVEKVKICRQLLSIRFSRSLTKKDWEERMGRERGGKRMGKGLFSNVCKERIKHVKNN